MKHFLKSAAAVLLPVCFLCTSCGYGIEQVFYRDDEVTTRSSSVTTLTTGTTPYAPSVGSAAVYSALVITDVHFGASKTRHDDAFYTWFETQLADSDETLRPRFVVCLGDSVENGTEEQYALYKAFCDKLRELGNAAWNTTTFQVYTVAGNHDLFNSGWNCWKSTVYPYISSYRFTTLSSGGTTGWEWYFLDCGNGTLGSPQLKSFVSCAAEDSLPKLVFLHYPVYRGGVFYFTMQNTTERNQLITAFANDNCKVIFEGHSHTGGAYDFGAFRELGVKAYLDYKSCCLATVNESSGTCTTTEYTYYSE